MSDTTGTSGGPLMLSATSVLRSKFSRTRVGRIGGNVTLPRPVEVGVLASAGGGFLFGLVVGLVVLGNLQYAFYLGALLGAVGYFLYTFSPAKGETVVSYVSRNLEAARRSQLNFRGTRVRVAVGIAPMSAFTFGTTFRIFPGAVEVDPDGWDERGVPIRVRPDERLLRPAGTPDPLFGPTRPLPDNTRSAPRRATTGRADDQVPPRPATRPEMTVPEPAVPQPLPPLVVPNAEPVVNAAPVETEQPVVERPGDAVPDVTDAALWPTRKLPPNKPTTLRPSGRRRGRT
jgi:hypothetical protein